MLPPKHLWVKLLGPQASLWPDGIAEKYKFFPLEIV